MGRSRVAPWSIGVSNYLFANPVSAGDNAPNGRNLLELHGPAEPAALLAHVTRPDLPSSATPARPPRFQANLAHQGDH